MLLAGSITGAQDYWRKGENASHTQVSKPCGNCASSCGTKPAFVQDCSRSILQANQGKKGDTEGNNGYSTQTGVPYISNAAIRHGIRGFGPAGIRKPLPRAGTQALTKACYCSRIHPYAPAKWGSFLGGGTTKNLLFTPRVNHCRKPKADPSLRSG